MGYRDDREALHNRIAKLEAELEQARREGEERGRSDADRRAAVLEAHVREMRAELERIEKELAELRGVGSRSSSMRAKLGLVVGAGVVAVFVAGVLVGARNGKAPRTLPPEPVSPPMKVPQMPAPPIPQTVATTASPPPERGVPRSAHPRWMAKVTRAEGVSLAQGGLCLVETTVRTADTNAIVTALSVYCGSLALYRSGDELSGISESSSSVREVLGPTDDKGTFTLVYRDIGPRTGARSQIDLDSTQGQAVVWRETIPRFKVELALERESIPGPPLSGFELRLRRSGKIVATKGAAPAKTGAACVLRAMATGREAECAAEIRCGDAILWPKTAPVSCTYEKSRPVTVAAEGLTLDETTLSVKTEKLEATIALDPP